MIFCNLIIIIYETVDCTLYKFVIIFLPCMTLPKYLYYCMTYDLNKGKATEKKLKGEMMKYEHEGGT